MRNTEIKICLCGILIWYVWSGAKVTWNSKSNNRNAVSRDFCATLYIKAPVHCLGLLFYKKRGEGVSNLFLTWNTGMPNLKTTTMPKRNLSSSLLKLTNFYNLMWIQGTAIKITITYYAFYNLKISINVLYGSKISPKHNKADSVGGKTHSLFANVSTCDAARVIST
jgi:hypothetical protein